MKNRKMLCISSLALALILAIGLALNASASSGSLSKSEIDSIVETTTDASTVVSPFTAAVKAVRDSVVLVRNYQISRSTGISPFGWGFDYGYGFGYGDGYNGGNSGTERLAGTGSGSVISNYGHVLTNYHVVEDASRVTVFDGENEYAAEVVVSDEALDIAVLLCPELNLPAVTLGDSDQLQEGEWAIVIGNPLGEDFFRSTTVGVVSSLERKVEASVTDKYGRKSTTENSMIQVDAAINSGNSGGGMFNVLGQLMGIPVPDIQRGHASGVPDHAHRQGSIEDRDAPLADRALQCLRHHPAGQGSRGGGPAARIMVRLVACVFPVRVRGKRHAQLTELQEARRAERRLTQGDIAVDIAPPEGRSEVAHAVGVVAAERQLIVGLLVAARIPGGSRVHVLRHQQAVYPQLAERIRGVQSGAA